MRRHRETESMISGNELLTQTPLDDKPQDLQSFGVPEINFRRLLRKCEDMSDSGDYESWRFEKYVEALEQLLNAFKGTLEKAKRDELLLDRLSQYERRVATLKSIARPDITLVESRYRSLLLGDHDPPKSPTSPRNASEDDIVPNTTRNSGQLIESSAAEPSRLSEERSQAELIPQISSLDAQRSALFDQSSPRLAKDLDIAMTTELSRQGQITDEMLYLAQSLKENMMTAQTLIKKDFKVIDKATAVADRNAHRLEKEAEKLAEQNKKNTSWWVLLALIGLFGIFVMMVLFMRLFPKPRAYRI